jgi:hypothetical protein
MKLSRGDVLVTAALDISSGCETDQKRSSY